MNRANNQNGMKMEYMDLSEVAGCSHASLSIFRGRLGNEYHLVLTGLPGLGFARQCQSLWQALATITASLEAGVKPVFARCFLSDPANQVCDLIHPFRCALSVVGQAPLMPLGAKIGVWVILRDKVSVHNAFFTEVASAGGVTEYWSAGCHRPGETALAATCAIMGDLDTRLRENGMSMACDCHRTWLFVRDVDRNYADVVQARNHVFEKYGLSASNHFIASTGIEGSHSDPSSVVMLDSYSVKELHPDNIKYLKGASHLNPTYQYGVAFERGTTLQFPDRKRILISGTASIDNKGRIVGPRDIRVQTRRMLENVGVLLGEAGAGFKDLQHITVYLRDPADIATVHNEVDMICASVPKIFVLAPVCRPGWLVEMECMAMI